MLRDTPRTLILDFDNTIANSIKAVCEVYNDWFIPKHIEIMEERIQSGELIDREIIKEFKVSSQPADWTKVNTWNMVDQCKLLDENLSAIDIFGSSKFFDVVELYDGAKEALEALSEITNIVICSAGTPMNIALKVLWIEENLPFADIVPVIMHGSNGVGKSIVNMEGAVFIDDHADNLIHSNADINVCYGAKKDWNRDYNGIWMNDWGKESVDKIFEMLMHN